MDNINSGKAIIVREVISEHDALKVADLYISYYKRLSLTKETFLEKWRFAQSHENYFILAAYHESHNQPLGFLDFAIIPSIFWAPCLGRIDSTFIADQNHEKEILNNLFNAALEIMNKQSVSKIIAVTCTNYQQETRLLTSKMDLDDNPTKKFFTLVVEKK